MKTEDYKRLSDEVEAKRGETPEQAKTEAYKALIRMLNYIYAQFPAEAYNEVVDRIISDGNQLRFTIYMPATTIEMEAVLIEAKTGKAIPLFMIDAHGSTTKH